MCTCRGPRYEPRWDERVTRYAIDKRIERQFRFTCVHCGRHTRWRRESRLAVFMAEHRIKW
jgi:hypothetical protein